MIKIIKIDGSGDAPNINTALFGFLSDLDTGAIPADETLTITLADGGVYDVEYLTYYVSRQVQTKITIAAASDQWQQATIRMIGTDWFEWNTPLIGSYLNLEVEGCILEADGTLFKNHDQDISIKNCLTTGTGTLVESENGQVEIDHVLGSALDVFIDGDKTSAARGIDGGDMTIDRPAMVVNYSRLGNIESNKPVTIRNCFNCYKDNVGISSYKETATYDQWMVPFTDYRKIGSLLDRVSIISSDDEGLPLMTLSDGGLYRKVFLSPSASGLIPDALIVVNASPLHMIAIDRCLIRGGTVGIKIVCGEGVINVTNNMFKDVGLKIRESCCQRTDRVYTSGNRGPAPLFSNGCIENGTVSGSC